MQTKNKQFGKQNTFVLGANFSELKKEEIYSCIPRSREEKDISYDNYTLL
jgi:hypothetical protein